MLPTTSVPPVRVGDPTSLVAVVPYLLGFRPESSLVLVALAERGRVAVTGRVDLPQGLPALGLDALRDAAATLGRAAARAAGRSAVAVLYLPTGSCPQPLEPSWQEVGAVLTCGLSGTGLRLLDVLAVADGRRWSLRCGSADCCPPDGVPMPPAGSTAVEAAAVTSGLVVRGSRADVARLLDPADPERRAEVAAELARRSGPGGACAASGGRAASLAAADDALCNQVGRMTAATAADLLGALSDVQVRDSLVVAPGPDAVPAAVRCWTELVRLAPHDRVAPAATMLAAAAYQRGDGALASLALERALEVDPGYSLASLLAASLAAGVPPEPLFDGLRIACAEARASVVGLSGSLDAVEPPGADRQDEGEGS